MQESDSGEITDTNELRPQVGLQVMLEGQKVRNSRRSAFTDEHRDFPNNCAEITKGKQWHDEGARLCRELENPKMDGEDLTDTEDELPSCCPCCPRWPGGAACPRLRNGPAQPVQNGT